MTEEKGMSEKDKAEDVLQGSDDAEVTVHETGEEGKEASTGAEAADEQGFREILDEKRTGEAIDLDFLLDIPLEVSVELGRTKMVINDLLQLGQGSVLELPKLAGEPLEILINNKLVARGEPVMVNEKLGIRLTDIISPLERIKQLK